MYSLIHCYGKALLEQVTMIKECKECGEEKGLNNFYRDSDTLCKPCTIEYQKNWRKKKRESSNDAFMRIIDRLIMQRSSITNETILEKLQEMSEANAIILKKLEEMSINDPEASPENVKSSEE